MKQTWKGRNENKRETEYRKMNIRMTDSWLLLRLSCSGYLALDGLVVMNGGLERTCGLLRAVTSVFARLRKATENPSVPGLPAEIRTQYLPNAKQE
jgi:hypothetical protein